MSDFYISITGRLCYKCVLDSGKIVLRPIIALYAYEVIGIEYQIVLDDRQEGGQSMKE